MIKPAESRRDGCADTRGVRRELRHCSVREMAFLLQSPLEKGDLRVTPFFIFKCLSVLSSGELLPRLKSQVLAPGDSVRAASACLKVALCPVLRPAGSLAASFQEEANWVCPHRLLSYP